VIVQRTPLPEASKRAEEPTRSLFQNAVDFLFGYDFFISYAWKDARSYAVAVANKLRTQGFECFLDSTEYAKGDDWRRAGKRALRERRANSFFSALPKALDSEAVLHEVEAFQSTNRTILPIDFGGILRNPGDRSSPLLQKLSLDILSITEPLERLGIGPSENTLKEIRDGFRITRQQQKRLRWFAGAAFAFAIIAAFAGWQWYEAGVARDAAKEEARIAESRRLAAESSSALIKYPQRSLLLAVEAVKLGQSVHGVPVAAAEQSLREALGVIGGRALAISQSPTSAVAISPDNHWLVTGSGDKTARLWDLSAKDPAANPIVLRGHEGAVYAVGISPDNHWLVTSSADKTAHLWDLSTKDPAANPVVLRGHEGWVNAVAISPDNHWLVTGSDDKTARLWDLSAKDPAANPVVLRGHKSLVNAVAISPDSHWLVTGGSSDGTMRLWDLTAKDPAANPVCRQHACRDQQMRKFPVLHVFTKIRSHCHRSSYQAFKIAIQPRQNPYQPFSQNFSFLAEGTSCWPAHRFKSKYFDDFPEFLQRIPSPQETLSAPL